MFFLFWFVLVQRYLFAIKKEVVTKSIAMKKRFCVIAVDICDSDCPVAKASDVLSGKWTTLIVRDLLSGVKRYSELQRSLAGISPRMLGARLAMLESAGLISKTIYPTVPPKTEYRLTDHGRQIEPVITAMAAFGATLGATPLAISLGKS
jgi:DNA-binding HxlR family transcriptional regulator